MSVREEFWVSPWLVSYAENVLRGAYDDCGHFTCHVVEVFHRAAYNFARLCSASLGAALLRVVKPIQHSVHNF